MDHKPPHKTAKHSNSQQLRNMMEIYQFQRCLKGCIDPEKENKEKGVRRRLNVKFVSLVISDNFMQIGTKIFTKTPRIFLKRYREKNNFPSSILFVDISALPLCFCVGMLKCNFERINQDA